MILLIFIIDNFSCLSFDIIKSIDYSDFPYTISNSFYHCNSLQIYQKPRNPSRRAPLMRKEDSSSSTIASGEVPSPGQGPT
mmetsp:Transcript_11482/g.17549  ORF Transcript_11482/g.17549 Transcript_11482/m.17549 type:complete len:81 (-) Transcript_11482:325-567(-)